MSLIFKLCPKIMNIFAIKIGKTHTEINRMFTTNTIAQPKNGFHCCIESYFTYLECKKEGKIWHNFWTKLQKILAIVGSSWRKAVESALSFSAATLPFDEFFVLALVAQNHRSLLAFTQPADRRQLALSFFTPLRSLSILP